jgi:hypothetical protein
MEDAKMYWTTPLESGYLEYRKGNDRITIRL